MNPELIRLIQFAIDNELILPRQLSFNKEDWYVPDDIIKNKWYIESINKDINDTLIAQLSMFDWKINKTTLSVYELITSKPFIEAVARGINPTMKNWSMWLNIEIDWITTKQAIAIRDNKLPEFINNLLFKE